MSLLITIYYLCLVPAFALMVACVLRLAVYSKRAHAVLPVNDTYQRTDHAGYPRDQVRLRRAISVGRMAEVFMSRLGAIIERPMRPVRALIAYIFPARFDTGRKSIGDVLSGGFVGMALATVAVYFAGQPLITQLMTLTGSKVLGAVSAIVMVLVAAAITGRNRRELFNVKNIEARAIPVAMVGFAVLYFVIGKIAIAKFPVDAFSAGAMLAFGMSIWLISGNMIANHFAHRGLVWTRHDPEFAERRQVDFRPLVGCIIWMLAVHYIFIRLFW